MEEDFDKGCVVEVVMPTHETIKAVVIEASSYIDDYELGDKIHYTLMLYAPTILFYATCTYEKTYWYNEDENGYSTDGSVEEEYTPLTFKSIIATDVIMPKADEQLINEELKGYK